MAILTFAGCTEKERARAIGGESTTYVAQDQKLINVTWKSNDLWLLTRDRTPVDSYETYEFKEDSSYGVFEGTIKIIEQK